MKRFSTQKILNTLQNNFEIQIVRERDEDGNQIDNYYHFENENEIFYLHFTTTIVYVEYSNNHYSEMYGPEQVKTTKEIIDLLVQHFIEGGPKEIVNRYKAKNRDRLIGEILND